MMYDEDPERNPATRKPILSLVIVVTLLIGGAIAGIAWFLHLIDQFAALGRLHNP